MTTTQETAMMDVAHNPAFEVRTLADVEVVNPDLGHPTVIPAGTLGVIDPFSVHPSDPNVSVVFARPHRPRYGRGSLAVPASSVEWVNPADAAQAYRLPEGATWTQPVVS